MEMKQSRRIAVGGDHAGFEGSPPHYKPAVIHHLEELGYPVSDLGARGPESVDYPDFAAKVCEAILNGDADCGVLICGTGIGVAMAANRYKGIRAAPVATEEMVRLSRTHNNSNILCLGARITPLDEALRFLDIWLDTPFSGGERHTRRIEKMG